MNAPELVCGECPLATCDEDSLWCLYRFLTRPNALQQPLVGIQHRAREKTFSAARYRDDHRQEKRAYDRARYAQQKETHE